MIISPKYWTKKWHGFDPGCNYVLHAIEIPDFIAGRAAGRSAPFGFSLHDFLAQHSVAIHVAYPPTNELLSVGLHTPIFVHLCPIGVVLAEDHGLAKLQGTGPLLADSKMDSPSA